MNLICRNKKSNCLGVFYKSLFQEKKKNSPSGKKVANKNGSSNSNFVDDDDDAALMQVNFIILMNLLLLATYIFMKISKFISCWWALSRVQTMFPWM